MKALAAMTLAAALSFAAQAQQDFSKVEVTTMKLNDGIYMLTGAGGNLGLSVGGDAVFLIDDQFAPLAPKIKAAIAALTGKPLTFLLNTHFHFDHTGGNQAFGDAGAVIVAHDNVRKRMSTDQVMAFIGATQPASPKAALPVLTVPGELRFHINGEMLHAFHAPNAHTDGDLIVHFTRGNVIHMGDTLFSGMYPFIDVGNGGSVAGVIAAQDRVLALADAQTRIIPGHGPLTDKAGLQAHRDMLATVAQRIKDLRAAGKSDEDIAAARPAADYDERYGQGFIKPDRFVLMMLAALPR